MNDRSPFRLAFRVEGEFVNCYFADNDSLDDALLLGSMRRNVLDKDRAIWEAWKTLMQTVISEACLRSIGVAPESFGEIRAPEHEKAGRA